MTNIYRYKFGDIDKIKSEHSILSSGIIKDIKGSLFIDIVAESENKNKIDSMLQKYGFRYYDNLTAASGIEHTWISYGNEIDYMYPATQEVNKIQLIKVWLDSNKDIGAFKTFVGTAISGAHISMGLYSQINPYSDGEPSGLICSSSYTMDGTESFITLEISPYEITTNGYYWLAIVCDNNNIIWASTMSYMNGFLPARWCNHTGYILPNEIGETYKSAEGIVFMSVRIEG